MNDIILNLCTWVTSHIYNLFYGDTLNTINYLLIMDGKSFKLLSV